MARISGAFPFPLAQVQEGTTRVALQSGGVFYIPSNQWLLSTDAHTLVQYFESQSQSWQTILGHSQQGAFTTDGFNYRAINDSGIVTSTSITAGSGATNGIGSTATGVTLAVAASNTTNFPTATLQPIVGGSVAAPTITQAGSGFLVPPVIVVDPPPQGGIQATCFCTLNATGGIATVTMGTVGAGYIASPNFWIIPQPAVYQGGPQGASAAGAIPPPGVVFPGNAPPGIQNIGPTGAQLTSIALTGSGTLTGVIIVNAGGGYTSANPAVTVTGGAGGMAVTATVGTTSLQQPSTLTLAPRIND